MGSNQVARQDRGSVLGSALKTSARWTAAWMRQGLIAWSIGAVLLGAAWPVLADEGRDWTLGRIPALSQTCGMT
jgi:hypothetical protein